MTYKIKRINEDKVNAILTALLEGPKTKYTLEKKDRVASGGTIYNYCKILLERKLIIIEKKEEFKPTGMDKKYYKITFPGLLHLIKNNVITIDEGHKKRLQAKLEFPLEGKGTSHLRARDKKNMQIFFKTFESVAPDLFYQYLISTVFENEFIPPIAHLIFAGVWTQQRLQEMEDKRFQVLNRKIRDLEKIRGWPKFVAQNKKTLAGLL